MVALGVVACAAAVGLWLSSPGLVAGSTDSAFLAAYAEGSSARRTYLRENRDALLGIYGRVASALDRAALELEQPEDAASAALRRRTLIGAQTARSVAAYIRQQTAPDNRTYAEARNLGMAENVRFLADVLYPSRGSSFGATMCTCDMPPRTSRPTRMEAPASRRVIWGAGSRHWYGDDVYTIGFYAYRGTAVNNAREEYSVEEARLAQAGYRLAFFDLRGQGAWSQSAQTVRYNGRHDQVLVPSAQYDGLVIIVDVSPPEFLY